MQRNELKNSKWIKPASILLLAFAVYVVLAVVSEGFEQDVNCFSSWALRMAETGPAGFYEEGYFADYPPGYMLVLTIPGALCKLFHLEYAGKAMQIILSALPILCSLGCAALIGGIAKKYAGEKAGLIFMATAAFCPALLYDTAIWKQIDSVMCLLMLVCFYLLMEKKHISAALVFGLALSIKPQALLFGPVLAICFLVWIYDAHKTGDELKTTLITLVSAFLSVGVVLLTAIPFAANQETGWLLAKYLGTMLSYPYASVCGFNLLAMLGGNWLPLDDAAFGGITWRMLGNFGVIMATVLLAFFAIRSKKNGRYCPLLLAAFYGIAVFTLAHTMHERYVLPAVILVLAAAARWGDRRLLGVFWLTAVSSLVNQAMVLASNGTKDQFLVSDTARVMITIISAIMVGAFALLLWTVWELTGTKEKIHPFTHVKTEQTRALPKWTGREIAFVALVTLAVAAISLFRLGDKQAPESYVDAVNTGYGEEIIFEEPVHEIWIYTGVTWPNHVYLTKEDETELASIELTSQDGFKWKKMTLEAPIEPGTYYMLVFNSQIMEAAFFNENGKLAKISGNGALTDEQDLIPDEFGYMNTAYFDEIYHARTAYEHLHGRDVFETTHPPLGKVFIMLGIALFGMNGFGWRVAGVIFGIAMVPLMYIFVRRLTRSQFAAGLSMLLLALDGMRFTQTRIATIDVYGTFFILLGAYFMIWYCQSVLEKGVCGSILPMALAGISFGLGAASKWTGIYAGAGLAILYFAVLWKRGTMQKTDFIKEVKAAMIGGVVFFVIVPILLYIAAYFPYWWREGGFSLNEWWECQKVMLNYHATLTSEHPFESRWYTWMFLVRPVWYHVQNMGEGLRSSISGMGNPIVWWTSTVCIALVMWRQFSGRAKPVGGALTVLYLSQLLPWTIITRCTYMYHYFPSLIFAIAAIGFVAAECYQKKPKQTLIASAALVGTAMVLFVMFYPVYSGIAVDESWTSFLGWLPSWAF